MSTPLSPAQAAALTTIATATLYVGRDPGRPDYGAGYAGSTLRKLTARGLIRRGEYVPGRGRPLQLTPAGEAAVAALRGDA
jgi:hypothetical protein